MDVLRKEEIDATDELRQSIFNSQHFGRESSIGLECTSWNATHFSLNLYAI